MAMVPVLERPAQLRVAEMRGILEFLDQRAPFFAQRHEWHRSKADQQLRPFSCNRMRQMRHVLWCRELRAFDVRLLPRRHDARQVLGICEKPENLLDRIRYPKLRLIAMPHEITVTVRQP